MTTSELALVISGYDHTSGMFSRVTGSFRKFRSEVKYAWQEGKKLEAISKALSKGGNYLMAAGAGAGAALGFGRVAGEAADAEHTLAMLANTANLSAHEVQDMQASVLSMARRTNQSQSELLTALGALLSRGLDKGQAMDALESIGKAATATGANVEDMAKTAFVAMQTMKVPASQVGQLLDSLAQAGKEGSFELKDMAKFMPELASKASALGMSGHRGVVQLAAWGQIAKLGTDDPAVAANNLSNFLDKLTGKEAVANFKKKGINLEVATSVAWQSGDFIGTMLRQIKQVTKGNPFILNELFGDVQVKNFITPALQNLDKYQGIADRSMGAKGIINTDHARMMATFTEQWKNFQVTTTEKLIPVVGPWLSRATRAVEWLGRHTWVLNAAITSVLIMLGGGLAMKGIATILGMKNATISTTKSVIALGSRLVQGGKDFAYCAKNATSLREGFQIWSSLKMPGWLNKDIGPTFSRITAGSKAFTVATWGSVKALWAQAVAFAATPFGMVTIAIVALIAVGVLLWKNWDKVTAFFKRAWAWFQGAWSKVPGWAKWFMPFISIPMLLIKNWSKIKDVFLSLWGFIKGMSSQFWNAGKNIVKAIWEGMKSLASKPVDAIKNIVGKVRRFLPFSPAKEGPLSDIHKVGGGLLGTITSSLKPSALLAKVQGIAGQVRSALGGAVSVASNPIGALKAAAGAVGGNHYHFHLTVPPGTTAQQASDLERQLDAILPRLRAKLALATDRQQRGAFA